MTWRNAIKLSKIKSKSMRMLNLGTKIIMIYREEEDFLATEGLCRHMRWPLSWGGKIEDGFLKELREKTKREKQEKLANDLEKRKKENVAEAYVQE